MKTVADSEPNRGNFKFTILSHEGMTTCRITRLGRVLYYAEYRLRDATPLQAFFGAIALASNIARFNPGITSDTRQPIPRNES